MELSVFLICCVVIILCAIFVYGLIVFLTREKSYEEVLAEQRQKNIELFGKSADGEKKKDKKDKIRKRKQAKQAAEETSATTTVTENYPDGDKHQEADHKMLEIELEPEIIDEDHPRPPESKKKSAGKGKSILHNKNEKTPVLKTTHVEEKFHPKMIPRDDLELKHEKERRQSATLVAEEVAEVASAPVPKNKKGKKAVKEARVEPQPVVVQEEIKMVSAPVVNAEPKKSKKTKSAPAPQDFNEDSKGAELRNMVQMTQLNDNEIQVLVELLLSKQTSTSPAAVEWTKKSKNGDPVAILKKQLQDKEKELQDEQAQRAKSSDRVTELKQKMSAEAQRYSLAQTKIDQQAEDIAALHQRMASTAEAHMAELRALRGQVEQYQQQASFADPHLVQRLQEENKQLQEAQTKAQQYIQNQGDQQNTLKLMSEQLSSTTLELNSVKGENSILVTKCNRMEEEMRKQQANKQSGESVYNQRLNELSQQLQQLQAQKQSFAADLEKERREAQRARDEVNMLKQQMSSSQESTSQVRELEQKIQEMEASLSSAQQQVAVAQSEAETSKTNASSTSKRLQELEAILAEKDSVLHEVESKLSSAQSSSQDQEQRVSELNQKLKDFEQSKQQMAAELQVLQEARQQAAVAEPVVAEVAQAVNAAPPSEELTKQLQEKDSELSRVQAELAAKLAEITQLKDDVEAQSRKNNDSTQTIQQLESRIEELNKTVETGTALNVSSSEQLTMFKDKIAHFESQVTTLEQQLEEARKVGATTATTTAESEALTAEVQKLAEEKNRIQSELQIAQSKLSAMDSDLQTSNKELESQKSQLEASNARITEQEKQLVSLQDTLANNAQELKLTKESLESKTTELGVVSQQLCSAKEEANVQVSASEEPGVRQLSDNGSDVDKVNLPEQIDSLKEEITVKEDRIQSLTRQITQSEWSESEKLLNELNRLKKDHEDESLRLKQMLEGLKQTLEEFSLKESTQLLEISSLKFLIDQYETELMTKNEEEEALKRKLGQFQEDLKAFEQTQKDHISLVKMTSELKVNYNCLQEKITQLESVNLQLQEEKKSKANMSQELSNMKERNSQLETNVRAKEIEFQQRLKEFEQTQKDHTFLVKKTNELKDKYHKLQVKITQLENIDQQLHEERTSKANLLHELSNMKACNRQLEDTCRSVERKDLKELEQTQKEHNSLLRKTSELKDKCNSLEEKITKLENIDLQLQEEQTSKANLLLELSNMKERNSQMEEEFRAKERKGLKELEQTQKDHNSLLRKTSELKNKCNNLEEKITILEDIDLQLQEEKTSKANLLVELNTMKERNSQMEEEFRAKETKGLKEFEQTQKDHNSLLRKTSELKNKCNNLEEKITKLENIDLQLQEEKTSKANLLLELSNMKERNIQMEEEFRAKEMELVKEIQQLTEEIDSYRGQDVNQLKEKIAAQEAEILKFQTDIDELKTKGSKVTDHKGDMEEKVQSEQERHIEELQDQILVLQSRIDSSILEREIDVEPPPPYTAAEPTYGVLEETLAQKEDEISNLKRQLSSGTESTIKHSYQLMNLEMNLCYSPMCQLVSKERRKLVEQIQIMESAFSTQTNELTALRGENEGLMNQIKELSNQNQMSASGDGKIANGLDSPQHDVEKVGDFDDQVTEKKMLEQTLASTVHEKNSLEIELAKLTELCVDLPNKKQEVVELTRSLTAKEEQLAKNSIELTTANDKIKMLEEEVSNLTKQLQSEIETAKETLTKFNNLNAEKTDIENENQQHVKEIQELVSSNEALRIEIVELSGDKEVSKSQKSTDGVNDLQEQISHLRILNRRLIIEISELRKDREEAIEKLKVQSTSAHKDVEKITKQVKDEKHKIEVVLKKKEEELEDIKEKYDIIKNHLLKLENERQELEKANYKLKQMNSDLASKVKKSTEEIDKMIDIDAKRDVLLKQAVVRFDNKTFENESLKVEMKGLVEENHALKMEIAEKTKNLQASLNEEETNIDTDIANLRTLNKRLVVEVAQLRQTNDEDNQIITRMKENHQEEILEWKKKIESLEKILLRSSETERQLQLNLRKLQAELDDVKSSNTQREAPKDCVQTLESHIEEVKEITELVYYTEVSSPMASPKKENMSIADSEHVNSLTASQAPNGDVNNQILALQQQLEITRKENEELRAGCEKATKALTSAEKAAEEIAQIQKQLNTKASEVTSLRDKLSTREKEIAELKDKNLKAVDALSKVEKVSQVQVQEAKSDEDSKAAQAKLQAEVQHYKAILADTEGILNKLQSSVESEERKWHSKVRSYEDEVAQLRAELNRVKTTESLQNGNGTDGEAASAASNAGTAL